jgi:hypothetical protein
MRPNLMTRLALLEAAELPRAWEHTQGLAALLTVARALPARDPFALDEISDTGMGRLLKEARAWKEDLREGTCDQTSFGGCVSCPLCRS